MKIDLLKIIFNIVYLDKSRYCIKYNIYYPYKIKQKDRDIMIQCLKDIDESDYIIFKDNNIIEWLFIDFNEYKNFWFFRRFCNKLKKYYNNDYR